MFPRLSFLSIVKLKTEPSEASVKVPINIFFPLLRYSVFSEDCNTSKKDKP